MSIWRQKRRYEENRRFSERADDALLAIGLIKNSSEGIEGSREEVEIRQKLSSGIELLQELKTALEQPEHADDYSLALSHELCDELMRLPEDTAKKLEEDIDAVTEAQETLTTSRQLDAAAETFEKIEAVAARISESDAENMRNEILN